MKYDKKLTKEIEHYEALTHVYVAFCDNYVDLQGEFTPEELSAIASIQKRKMKADDKKPTMPTLW